MASNFLNLNEKETEVIIFGPSGVPDACDLDLHSLEPFKATVANLGFKLHNYFKLDAQVNAFVKADFFQLRLIFQCALTIVILFMRA